MAVITAEESRETTNHTHSPSLMRCYRRSGRLSAMVSGVNQSMIVAAFGGVAGIATDKLVDLYMHV